VAPCLDCAHIGAEIEAALVGESAARPALLDSDSSFGRKRRSQIEFRDSYSARISGCTAPVPTMETVAISKLACVPAKPCAVRFFRRKSQSLNGLLIPGN
jgi:hypothetical protein